MSVLTQITYAVKREKTSNNRNGYTEIQCLKSLQNALPSFPAVVEQKKGGGGGGGGERGGGRVCFVLGGREGGGGEDSHGVDVSVLLLGGRGGVREGVGRETGWTCLFCVLGGGGGGEG